MLPQPASLRLSCSCFAIMRMEAHENTFVTEVTRGTFKLYDRLKTFSVAQGKLPFYFDPLVKSQT